MTIWEAVILGLVQGLTEFLPISSSGHLVLLQEIFNLNSVVTFDIFIHLATLLAILVFFGRSLFKVTFKEWILVGIGTIPAVLVGVLFKHQLDALFEHDKFLGVELIISGLINFYTDRKLKKPISVEAEKIEPHFKQGPVKSFLIGIAQAISIIPAISRSGSTVAASVGLGMDREAAFRYSFLLAIPAIAGAGVLQAHEIFKSGGMSNLDWPTLLVGGVCAFVMGLASLKLFKYVIEKAKLEWFGWYCVIFGIIIQIYTFTR